MAPPFPRRGEPVPSIGLGRLAARSSRRRFGLVLLLVLAVVGVHHRGGDRGRSNRSGDGGLTLGKTLGHARLNGAEPRQWQPSAEKIAEPAPQFFLLGQRD